MHYIRLLLVSALYVVQLCIDLQSAFYGCDFRSVHIA